MDKAELRTLTRKQLLALAGQRGLKGVSHLRKEELVAKLVGVTLEPSLSASPAHAPARPDVPAGGWGSAAVQTARSSRAPALPEEQSWGSGMVQPVNEAQRDALDCKFFLGSEEQPPHASALELPPTYNDNRLVLLARDPYWLYAYWDFSAEQMSAVQTQLGVKEAQPVLRVFDVTYIDFNGTNAWNRVDIELTPFATNWYIPVPRPDAAYCVEVGYRTRDGRFAMLGRSNVVATPRVEVSPSTTLRWMTPSGRPASLPPPQHPPLALSAIAREQGSWPLGPAGREALPPLPAPSSGQHPSSWSVKSKA